MARAKMYIKRPVRVEAWQFTLKDWDNRPEYVDPDWLAGEGLLYVPTLNGVVEVTEQEWIIRGVEGEVYPCADTIFRKTYADPDVTEKAPT